METQTVQAGTQIISSFGQHGGILGLVIAALFVVILILMYLIYKMIMAFNENTRSVSALIGILQNKPCLIDSEARYKFPKAGDN